MTKEGTKQSNQAARHWLPYGRQTISDDDVEAVVETLRSAWLTTGPKVEEFEAAIANYVNADYAVAVSNGTAALHAAMHAIGVGPGDEVLVPTLTFAASANCVVYQGGTPVFVDVLPETLLIDPQSVADKITSRTKAIVAVDYAGQPCDYDALRSLADRNGLALVADACHSLGATYRGKPVGSLADLTVFSFHPVKPITTAEGGMVTTNRADLAERMRRFRNHGISTSHRERAERGTWFYEMTELGYNYRLSDLQCALGISQLKKLPGWLVERREIAHGYRHAILNASIAAAITPLANSDDVEHAYHLCVVRCSADGTSSLRDLVYDRLRHADIGANVHYTPVHLHPFYRREFGTQTGDRPVAERAFQEILSLPIYPSLSESDVERIVGAMVLPATLLRAAA